MNQVGDVPNAAPESAPFVDNPRLWEGLPSQTNRYDDVFAGPRAARTMMPGSQSALMNPYTLNAKAPTEFDRFTPVHDVKIDEELASTLASTSTPNIRSPTRSTGTIIHPEGGPISHYGCVVSNQTLTDTHIAIAGDILEQCERSAEDTEITLFIQILGRQIDYYVVDHGLKAIIWVAGRVPESFKGATRPKHEHEYWIHMENFPGPYFSTPEDLSSLKHVLSSNAIDALTSEGSTSPMSIQQIQTHLRCLESLSGSGDIYQTYAVARLWNLILQSRAINKYATPEARLDRFISITDDPPAFAGTYASITRFMFNRPHVHLSRCSRTWADRIAYTEEWRKFKTTDEQEWKEILNLAQLISAFEDLRRRGCADVTGRLDLLRSSEYPIKSGGSGEVYSGKVSDISILVAIKISKWTKDMSDNEKIDSLKHAMHQALISSMCKHLNIHQFLGVAEYRDRFALISPWMVNGDLSEFLSRGSYPQARLYRMCSQICVAVAFMHELGIAHGDLKAQNILVSADFVLKIADFGSAIHTGGLWDSLVSKRKSRYSLPWAPHEMLEEDSRPTMPGDVHSVGMTLHEVISGSAPYAGMREMLVYRNVLNGTLPARPGAPSRSWSEKENRLWALLVRCWAYDAQDRPTAAQVRDEMCSISSRTPSTKACA